MMRYLLIMIRCLRPLENIVRENIVRENIVRNITNIISIANRFANIKSCCWVTKAAFSLLGIEQKDNFL